MLCEECMKNEASVTVTVAVGDEVKTRHLCPECMKKMELSLSQGDIQGFLSSILAVLSSPESAELTCGGCGLKYSEFERTGKLGCAQCYADFAEQLKPLLLRIHGRTQHAGERPQGDEATPPIQPSDQPKDENAERLAMLHQKMDEAVAIENFEDAAKYRDEIRALTGCANEG